MTLINETATNPIVEAGDDTKRVQENNTLIIPEHIVQPDNQDICEQIKDEDVPDCLPVAEVFPCTDIRYRSRAELPEPPEPVPKETALSLFIFSPLNGRVTNFIKKINNLRRRCTYESLGDCDQIVRMDYVFEVESNLKTFEKNVTELPRSQEIIMTMKTAPQELLLLSADPILSEKELLMICNESLSEKSLHDFSVMVLEHGDVFSFKFPSIMKLNVFLAIAVGYKDSFFGEIRSRSDVSLQLDFVKKYGKVKYPLTVKVDDDLDFEDLGKKYNFSMFTKMKNGPKKYATIDFKKKKDMFTFISREKVEFIFQIKE